MHCAFWNSPKPFLAVVQLALCQAVDLRSSEGCHARSKQVHQFVRKHIPVNDGDRRQDVDIHWLLEIYRGGELPIGAADFPAA